MYILNIETSTKNCSVSVAKSGKIVSFVEIAKDGYSHAELLHGFIEQVLDAANIGCNNLAAVAVSQGPGSYTGLRIGVSAAKGICYAMDIPLISVDTLLVLARQLVIENGLVAPMIDARRMEVYNAIFDANFVKIRETQAEILDDNSLKLFEEVVHIIGDCQDKIRTVLMDKKFVYHPEIVFPSAQQMGDLSFKKMLVNDFEDVAYFEPFYLKDFLGGRVLPNIAN